MHLTLFIPDLLPPYGTEFQATQADPAPSLRQLMGHGHRLQFAPIAPEVWLCQAFEVEQRQDWPVAALTASLDGLNVGDDWWIRADPVHLQLERNGSRIIAAPQLELDHADALALADTLNTYFTPDHIQLQVAHSTRWYIHQTAASEVVAPPLGAIAGRLLPRVLLSGAQASRWHRLLTEVQIALHDHPVNQRRSAQQIPTINSLYLWGGGHKPMVHGEHFQHLWSDDPLATALAIYSGAEALAAPANAASWFASKPRLGDQHLITLERAHIAVRYGGPLGWRKALATLEDLWFAPLQAALRAKQLEQITLIATGADRCLQITCRPTDHYKFWRSPLSWSALASSE